jgi:hypothetical protein
MNSTGITRISAAGLFIVSLLSSMVSGLEKVYIFYPSTFDFQSVQNSITDALPEITAFVFNRYDDFALKMKSEPPDAIITKPILIHEQFSDYEVVLSGERNGTTEASYLVLSSDTSFSIKSINSESVIGAIDILGRPGMKSFFKRYFPVEPKLKRVSRIGDLLPFLSLDVASGVLIENVFLDYFKSTSQLQFAVVPLPESTTGIIALAIKKGGSAEKTLNGLKQNNKAICRLFYIEQWK